MAKGNFIRFDGTKFDFIELDGWQDFSEAIGCEFIDIVERKIGDKIFSFIVDDIGRLKDDNIITAVSPSGDVMLVGILLIGIYHYDEETDNDEWETLTLDDLLYMSDYLVKIEYHYGADKANHAIVIDYNYD